LLNVLAAERMKLKRDRLLIVCTVTAILLPVMTLGGGANGVPPLGFIFRLQMMFQLCVYPVLSGFIITFLMQKEYGDLTIISLLTAPVSRMKFLLGKLTVWFIWHMAVTAAFLIISCAGVYGLCGRAEFIGVLPFAVKGILTTGIFNFGTLLPAAWIAVLQRKMYYPSLLYTLAVTMLGFAGLLQPGLLGSVMPWSAVLLLIMPGDEVFIGAAYTSIALCASVGFVLAAYSFKKQEL